jgi:flavin-dependent dehydrogenase
MVDMPGKEEEYQVIIIGGGPGGISTALHLARDYPEVAHRTLVIEKAHYPRFKLCAGGLVVDAEVILKTLGLDTAEVPHVDAEEVRLDFEGKGLGLRPPHQHALRIIRRDEFDAWLAGKAKERGIEIREGAAVRGIRLGDEWVRVETETGTFRAQVVVGADGSNGITRRCIFPGEPVSTARLLEIITPETAAGTIKTQSKRSAQHRETSAYFDFFPVPEGIAGYTWDFPTQVEGERRRCWGVYDTNMLAHMNRPALKEPLRVEMQRQGFELGDYDLKGHPIRWFEPGSPMAKGRVLLVGDAAGSDPLFGEGISIALGYGALAAQEIGEAFRRQDFSFSGYKRRVMRSSLGRSLLTRWLTAKVIYRMRWRWFQVLLWRGLKTVVLGAGWLWVVNWGKRLR